MNKYELIEPASPSGLYRIRALRDIPHHNVSAGDLGGWVAGERNLSQDGSAWVADDAQVLGDAKVLDNALVGMRARVFGRATVLDNAWVTEDARVFGRANISRVAMVSGFAQVYDAARLFGDARAFGNAKVFGNARVLGAVWVFGQARVFDWSRVSGNARLGGDAWVTSPDDVLVAGPVSSEGHAGTLYRTLDGHRVTIGCWSGTVDELRTLALGSEWPSNNPEEVLDRYRPRLLAFAEMCAAQVSLWSES